MISLMSMQKKICVNTNKDGYTSDAISHQFGYLSTSQSSRAGIRYFFGTGGIGIRYLKMGHSVSTFR